MRLRPPSSLMVVVQRPRAATVFACTWWLVGWQHREQRCAQCLRPLPRCDRYKSMCNRARLTVGPETLVTRFGADWLTERPMDNRFNPVELVPGGRAYVVRRNDRGLGVDVMSWDVLGGQANWPMTNVRNLALLQWRSLAGNPENRCLIPLTEFCEWTPEVYDVGGGKPLKGECGSRSPTSRSSPSRDSGRPHAKVMALQW